LGLNINATFEETGGQIQADTSNPFKYIHHNCKPIIYKILFLNYLDKEILAQGGYSLDM